MAENRLAKRRSDARDRLVDAPRELVQASLEHRAFGLGVGGEAFETPLEILLDRHRPRLESGDRFQDAALGIRVRCETLQAAPELGFRLREPALERRRELVPLLLEPRRDLAQPLLDALCACVADVGEPLGEDG